MYYYYYYYGTSITWVQNKYYYKIYLTYFYSVNAVKIKKFNFFYDIYSIIYTYKIVYIQIREFFLFFIEKFYYRVINAYNF